MIIAIDGHSSCGKSTLAKALAQKLGLTYVDSGAMYRAVTLYLIENKIDIQDEKAVEQALQYIDIDLVTLNGELRTFLNDKDVSMEIRKMEVSEKVSPVATLKEVRKKLVSLQRAIGTKKGVVMDGRDIGSVVFPKADFKFFVTADLDVRTHRRFDELKMKGLAPNMEEVKSNLIERDYIDSNREISPLRKVEDAFLIDNTLLNRDEQLDVVLFFIEPTVNS